jgi:hypothetical protein
VHPLLSSCYGNGKPSLHDMVSEGLCDNNNNGHETICKKKGVLSRTDEPKVVLCVILPALSCSQVPLLVGRADMFPI